MRKLTNIILENGVDSVYFIDKVKPLRTTLFMSYTTSSDPEVEMLCKINTERYKVEDNYKLTLEPIHEGFAKEHYYVSDLESLITEGRIKLLINKTLR